jgi:hypothetical protein
MSASLIERKFDILILLISTAQHPSRSWPTIPREQRFAQLEPQTSNACCKLAQRPVVGWNPFMPGSGRVKHVDPVFRNVDADIAVGYSHCPVLDLQGRQVERPLQLFRFIVAVAQMGPMLLSGMLFPWMGRGPTCSPIVPQLEQTRMEHHEQDDEQVFP